MFHTSALWGIIRIEGTVINTQRVNVSYFRPLEENNDIGKLFICLLYRTQRVNAACFCPLWEYYIIKHGCKSYPRGQILDNIP